MHGGSVSAHSAGLGTGSTFEIRLPLIEPPGQGSAGPGDRASSSKRVLIVDDNSDAAMSLAQVLALDGHVTEGVYGATEALQRVQHFAPDIVLLDIGLPEMDGYEVARRMRAGGIRSTLIALTGYGQAEDKKLARDAGFDGHMTKPVDFDALQLLIERHAPR
jgi:CheY-like chemotaxis protein